MQLAHMIAVCLHPIPYTTTCHGCTIGPHHSAYHMLYALPAALPHSVSMWAKNRQRAPSLMTAIPAEGKQTSLARFPPRHINHCVMFLTSKWRMLHINYNKRWRPPATHMQRYANHCQRNAVQEGCWAESCNSTIATSHVVA